MTAASASSSTPAPSSKSTKTAPAPPDPTTPFPLPPPPRFPVAPAAAILLLLAAALTPPAPLRAQAFYDEDKLIRPPFNIRWGLVPEDLLEILQRLKLPHTTETENGRITRITATALPQRHILRAIFHFEDNMLFEIELQMGQRGWQEDDYTRFFLQTKQLLDQRYGFGRPIVLDRKTSPTGIQTTLAGYLWQTFGGSIQLYFYQAQKDGRQTHILSQHFRPY